MRSFSRAVPMRAVLIAGIAAAAFGGISSVSTAKSAHPASGTTVDFYSSLPMQGAETAQTVPITNEATAKNIVLEQGASVEELVRALTAIGSTARDIIAILQNLKAAGALEAEVEVL